MQKSIRVLILWVLFGGLPFFGQSAGDAGRRNTYKNHTDVAVLQSQLAQVNKQLEVETAQVVTLQQKIDLLQQRIGDLDSATLRDMEAKIGRHDTILSIISVVTGMIAVALITETVKRFVAR